MPSYTTVSRRFCALFALAGFDDLPASPLASLIYPVTHIILPITLPTGIDDLHHNRSRANTTTKTPPRSVLQSTDLQTQLQLQIQQQQQEQQEQQQPQQQTGVTMSSVTRNQVTPLRLATHIYP